MITYITDALMTITENTAFLEGSKVMSQRYIEIGKGNRQETDKKDERTGDEIVNDLLNKIGV